jgi:radical SAM superfamily enzyme YgiQ (UPF0313 family)
MTGRRRSVALVNPPDPVRGADPAEQGPPPLGLCSIAAYLRAAGVRCDLFDLCAVGRLDELVPTGLLDHDVVGITAYTKTIGSAIDVARWVKARRPGATIVLGGPHATPCATELLVAEPAVDFVVRNDGEEPMRVLVEELSSDAPDLASVPSLTWRAHGSSALGVRNNPVLTPPLALDDLPAPARDFVVEPERDTTEWRRPAGPAPTAFVSTSRGCPKRCTFCSIIVMNPRWRFRSVDNVMAELRDLDRTAPFGHVGILDANFFVHARRVLAFDGALERWRPDVTWSATATADKIRANPDVVAAIAGRCAFLEIGIESGSDSVLERMGKRTTVADNRAAIEVLRRNGIRLDLDFIMFDPWTTVAELAENLEFLRDTELLGYLPADPIFNAVRIYPGTEVHDRCVAEFGLRATHDMDVRPPFVRPEVAVIHRAMSIWRSTYLREVQDLVPRLANGDGTAGSTTQRGRSASVRLRHLPYRLAEELVGGDPAALAGADAGEVVRSAATTRRTESLLREARLLVDPEPAVLAS